MKKKGFFITTVASLVVIAASVCVIFITVQEPSSRSDSLRRGGAPGRMPVLPDSTVAVRVAVFNGCGRPGAAAGFARRLRESGFDVVNGMGGNADSFDFPRSVVVVRRGTRASAERVALCLGVRAILIQRSENPYLMEDVAVVIGRNRDSAPIPAKEQSE